MGNSNQIRRLQDDFDISNFRGQSITFHNLHSDSIRLSHDSRVARRVAGFRGICFSNRPICVFERIYIRIADVSPSQSVGREGVLRVGLLSDNPSQLNTADLPTYASPDITYEQGYWAKAVPEPLARQGNVLLFYMTTNGDVVYGLNGKEIGVFFGGVQTDLPLWALMDLYGSTSCLELVDGFQISHYNSYAPAPIDTSWPPSTLPSIPDVAPFYPLAINSAPPIVASAWPSSSAFSLPVVQTSATLQSGGHAVFEMIGPMPFHLNAGRNIFFSHNLTVASRGRHDYCNGYVFTNRPLVPGEKLVVSILSITNEYSGGLAFGMTSCNPSTINEMTLPDDSDLLLDFPDYWVVHKDVYTKPEINDELTFYLTVSGEVRYCKNGHHIGTLMYVDTTLHLWAFFDIYGSTQQIKSLGVISPVAAPLSSTTTRNSPACMLAAESKVQEVPASLHPNSISRFPSTVGTDTICENQTLHRPTISSSKPHPNSALDSVRLSDAISTLSFSRSGGTRPRLVAELDRASRRRSYADEPPPPLPPKLSQFRSFSIAMPSSPLVGAPILSKMPSAAALLPNFVPSTSSPLDMMLRVSDVPVSLPPPLIPVPGKPAIALKPEVKPTRPQRRIARKAPSCAPPTGAALQSRDGGEPGQECVVCMERATDCALYMCGHMCMCFKCAVDIVRNQTGLCPICREPIKDIIKIFKS